MPRQREELRRVLARKEEELARLRRAAVLISSRAGLDETLQAILRMALEVTGARYGIFRLLDADGRLVTRAVVGEELTRPFVEALPACQLLNGDAAAVGEPPQFLASTSSFRSKAFHDLFREVAEQAWRDGRPVARHMERSAWTRVLAAPVHAGQRRAILGAILVSAAATARALQAGRGPGF